jgi:hypothetical protein
MVVMEVVAVMEVVSTGGSGSNSDGGSSNSGGGGSSSDGGVADLQWILLEVLPELPSTHPKPSPAQWLTNA